GFVAELKRRQMTPSASTGRPGGSNGPPSIDVHPKKVLLWRAKLLASTTVSESATVQSPLCAQLCYGLMSAALPAFPQRCAVAAVGSRTPASSSAALF